MHEDMTVTKLIACHLCGIEFEPPVNGTPPRYCVDCGKSSQEVFKAAAQLRKAFALLSALRAVDPTIQGNEIVTLQAVGRRLAEKAARIPESSDVTWAMAAVLASEM